MELERHGDTLTVRCRRDFNLMTVRHLMHHVQDATRIRVDLSRARIVDTEAIMALHELKHEGLDVTLLEPPPIFYEVLDVLELASHFDVERLVERPR